MATQRIGFWAAILGSLLPVATCDACFRNTSHSDPIRASLHPYSPCGNPHSCGYLCIDHQGTPRQLLQADGSWRCVTPNRTEPPGVYEILVENQTDAKCPGLLSALYWAASTPVAPVPVDPLFTPDGGMVCASNSTVGALGWNNTLARWECRVVEHDQTVTLLLIPNFSVLYRAPIDPPASAVLAQMPNRVPGPGPDSDPSGDDIPRMWPQPANVSFSSAKTSLILDASSFDIMLADDITADRDVLEWNVHFYKKDLFKRAGGSGHPIASSASATKPLQYLNVHVVQPSPNEYVYSNSYPSLGMDESYTLSLSSPNATLTANGIYGALRGMETFSQLLQMNQGFVIQGGDGLLIKDYPKFPWRGLMLDPARHFLSVRDINRTIDAMAQNKLNALHLHLSDGESFTVSTSSWSKFEKLSVEGAYSPGLAYTENDLRAIVAHGRLRGVRIIPEFDLPAHMASWSLGYPSLITDCPSVNPHPEWPRYYSPADVTEPLLYEVIDTILSELADVFPDPSWHIGGDEPHYDCWDANLAISKWKASHGNLTNGGLYAWFEGKYAGLLEAHNRSVIGWEEVLFNSVTPNNTHPLRLEGTVIEVWEGNDKLADVVKMGYQGIVSSNWYLNNGGDWTKYYNDDPLSYLDKNATTAQRKLVLGGEACMWNSAFDAASNMEPAMWPNAAAMAEQLWSPSVEDVTDARTRLSQQRCRMVRRGTRAAPIAEDYCDDTLYVRKSRTYSHPGDFPAYPNTPPP